MSIAPRKISTILTPLISKITLSDTLITQLKHDSRYFLHWYFNTEDFANDSYKATKDIANILEDYTKGGVIGRFFSGAWNRSFATALEPIISDYKIPCCLECRQRHLPSLIRRLDDINVNGNNPLKSQTGAFAEEITPRIIERLQNHINSITSDVINDFNKERPDWLQSCYSNDSNSGSVWKYHS